MTFSCVNLVSRLIHAKFHIEFSLKQVLLSHSSRFGYYYGSSFRRNVCSVWFMVILRTCAVTLYCDIYSKMAFHGNSNMFARPYSWQHKLTVFKGVPVFLMDEHCLTWLDSLRMYEGILFEL